jgi:uncharacterized protein
MVIDVHTHLHPPKLFAAIRRWFANNPGWQLAEPTEPRVVADTLRKFGVERFVFSSYAHRPGMARELNAWLTKTAQEIDFYGLPLFTVHLDDPDYVKDAELALAAGCIGLKIHEDVQVCEVNDKRFEPIYSLLAEHNGFVLAHIGPIPWKRVSQQGLARVISVLRKQPELKFLVAHMGSPDSRDYLSLLGEFPGLYLDTTMAFARVTTGYVALDVDEVEAHADRIVYGSDYPTTPYPYGKELDIFRNMNLTSASLEAILKGNAQTLMAPFMASVGRRLSANVEDPSK